jgi:hypothetical protein
MVIWMLYDSMPNNVIYYEVQQHINKDKVAFTKLCMQKLCYGGRIYVREKKHLVLLTLMWDEFKIVIKEKFFPRNHLKEK